MKRPWGSYRVIYKSKHCVVKEIVVNPKSRTSLQSHCHRIELWSFVSGHGQAIIGETTINVYAGILLEVKKSELHRLVNISSKPLSLIEIQHGSIVEESDIKRIEDDYGRK